MARVLVIEDNPASLELMVYLLKAFGHEPLRAGDGLQGVAMARAEIPELILCDIQLPGADGIEVCRLLKEDSGLQHIPIVAVTAYAMVGDRERLLTHGFDGYLSKPINPQTFIDQINPYLTSTKSQANSFATESGEAPPAQSAATILVVDNSPVNISLSRSILEPFGYDIVAAAGVDEALRIMEDKIPDLILSDLHIPRKDGFDFITAVKTDERFKDIPFLFISSTLWADREQERGLSLGAVQFIVRPIEPQKMIDLIDSCRMQTKAVSHRSTAGSNHKCASRRAEHQHG